MMLACGLVAGIWQDQRKAPPLDGRGLLVYDRCWKRQAISQKLQSSLLQSLQGVARERPDGTRNRKPSMREINKSVGAC